MSLLSLLQLMSPFTSFLSFSSQLHVQILNSWWVPKGFINSRNSFKHPSYVVNFEDLLASPLVISSVSMFTCIFPLWNTNNIAPETCITATKKMKLTPICIMTIVNIRVILWWPRQGKVSGIKFEIKDRLWKIVWSKIDAYPDIKATILASPWNIPNLSLGEYIT